MLQSLYTSVMAAVLTQIRRIFNGTIKLETLRSNVALKGASPGELGLGPDPGVREERVGPQQLLIPGG
jgi:hypothetical protein